jgi:hypothetical protein
MPSAVERRIWRGTDASVATLSLAEPARRVLVGLIILTLLASWSKPAGSLVEALGPLVVAWAFGAVSGIFMAGDGLTRGRDLRSVPPT